MSKPSRRSRGTTTIEDVARAAGVSAMTVSRVINGGQNVRETTRNSVLEAVKKLNYSPNTAARSLAAGEATHIGMLYANPSAAYLSQFLIGALHAARRAGRPPPGARPAALPPRRATRRPGEPRRRGGGHPPLRDQRRRGRRSAAAAF